jgi:uncharacterized cupredoxin-like copper-binding protein
VKAAAQSATVRRTSLAIATALAIGIVGLAACSGDSSSSADVSVILDDYTIEAVPASVASGDVQVSVVNAGDTTHELVAFRTDLAETDLPMNADGTRIDEEGDGITHIEPEAEGIEPGQDKTITMSLSPGRYVFVCNVALHYAKGMHTVVTVTG